MIARERHIRAAIGRDDADVPSTRGVFKEQAESKPHVAVRVLTAEEMRPEDDLGPEPDWLLLDGAESKRRNSSSKTKSHERCGEKR